VGCRLSTPSPPLLNSESPCPRPRYDLTLVSLCTTPSSPCYPLLYPDQPTNPASPPNLYYPTRPTSSAKPILLQGAAQRKPETDPLSLNQSLVLSPNMGHQGRQQGGYNARSAHASPLASLSDMASASPRVQGLAGHCIGSPASHSYSLQPLPSAHKGHTHSISFPRGDVEVHTPRPSPTPPHRHYNHHHSRNYNHHHHHHHHHTLQGAEGQYSTVSRTTAVSFPSPFHFPFPPLPSILLSPACPSPLPTRLAALTDTRCHARRDCTQERRRGARWLSSLLWASCLRYRRRCR
jgi:hypothetical protein